MQTIQFKEQAEDTSIRKDIYRRLRTNIEFTGVENRVLSITSCNAGDGKSTIAYYLAKSFADSDKSTILVDADMRKSVAYKRFGYDKNMKGLSHFLSGHAKASDVIYETNHANMYMLPTGIRPKNQAELLTNERFRRLVEVLREAFDYVIIDTPPLGLVVDAAIIAKECDGTLLVVDANGTSRNEAKSVKRQLVKANSNFLGVVLNQASGSGSSYGRRYGYGYGYGYNYGYGYGYGYGEEEEQDEE